MFVGHGTWSYMREEYAQKMSENRVMKGEFGAAREEDREGLRKLHNGEVSCFFFTVRQISLR